MKRTLWLLLLLPAVLATGWTAHRSYTWDPDYIWEQTVYYDLQYWKAPDEPLVQALQRAEGVALRENRKTSRQHLILSRPDYEPLWEAFAREGMSMKYVAFEFKPGGQENLIFSAFSSNHAAFIAWWRAHVDPEFQLRYPYYSLDESFMKSLPIPGSSRLFAVEGQAFNLNESPPRRERFTSVFLGEVYLSGVHDPRFSIGPDHLSYKGPLWPLVLIVLTLPAIFIYFLRRPILRLLPARLRPLSSK